MHAYIFILLYPLSYEPILALFLYNNLYVIILNTSIFLVGKILGGGGKCSYGDAINKTFNGKYKIESE